jgi:predicted transposase YdaD
MVFMREEDDRARLDKAEMKGKIELVIGMHEDGLEMDRIAKIAKMTAHEVREMIEKHLNK